MTNNEEQISKEDELEELEVEAEAPEKCQDQFMELKEQLDEIQGRYTRLAADFDNYKKRTERQTRDMVLRANQNLICGLLPILDNFCLALDSVPDESVLKGIRMIYDQLYSVLENEGLTAIDSLGSVFNPTLHEAVAHEEANGHEDNVIIQEIRRGYLLGGKVIRPSLVKVNIKKEEF